MEDKIDFMNQPLDLQDLKVILVALNQVNIKGSEWKILAKTLTKVENHIKKIEGMKTEAE